jgi:hypothetical protein
MVSDHNQRRLVTLTANEITRANADGARRLQIRALEPARIAQFWRSTVFEPLA